MLSDLQLLIQVSTKSRHKRSAMLSGYLYFSGTHYRMLALPHGYCAFKEFLATCGSVPSFLSDDGHTCSSVVDFKLLFFRSAVQLISTSRSDPLYNLPFTISSSSYRTLKLSFVCMTQYAGM